MDANTADRLLALNRTFYASFARAFSDSRAESDPAITCILPYVPPAARVLDVGCGNGRVALLLDRERPGSEYVGLDVVPELVEMARESTRHTRRISVEFVMGDIACPGWTESVRDDGFDTVVALAVLHHIPGQDRRIAALREIAAALRPSGRAIISTWQFLDSARLRRKLVPWDELELGAHQLDPGDYLLDWKRGGRGLRYCHLIGADEVRTLARECGLSIVHTFRAGGREGNLSLFAVLGPRP